MDKSKLAVSTYNKIAKIYTQKYFSDLSDTPYIDKFLKLLPPKAIILDVGCGPGQFTLYMSQKGFSVQGIDLSREMLNIARKKVPKGKFQIMDMRKLKFPDKGFDGLLVAYSLIHIPSEEILDTFRGFARVLKPGGYLEIIVQKGKPDQIVNEPFMPSKKMFFNFFTKEQLRNFLDRAGFGIKYQLETESADPDSASDKVIYIIAGNKSDEEA